MATGISTHPLVSEIMTNAVAIQSNAIAALNEWSASTPNQDSRERLLMELRHDLQDALKAVIARLWQRGVRPRDQGHQAAISTSFAHGRSASPKAQC